MAEPHAASAEPTPDPTPEPTPAPPAGAARTPGSLGLPDLRKLWDDVLEHVKGRSRIAHAALLGSQVVGVDAGRITVSFANEGMRTNFTRGNRAPFLHEALEALLALKVEIDTVVGAGSAAHAPDRPAPDRAAPDRAAPDRSAPDRSLVRSAAQAQAVDRPPAAAEPVPDSEDWPAAALPGGIAASAQPESVAPVRTEADDIGPDDPDLDDAGLSGADLLTRELGAEIIAERPTS